jgi:dihydroorotase
VIFLTDLYLSGPRVLNPARGTDSIADILIRDGKVVFPAAGDVPPGCEMMDCRGLWAMPGLVDMHVHLRTPGNTGAETLESGLRAALAGGVTTVGLMPNTNPPIDDPELAEKILRAVDNLKLAAAIPVPCVTVGGAGGPLTDLEAFASLGIKAFSDDGHPVVPDGSFREACERIAAFGGVLIEHPEDTTLAAGGVVNLGPVSTALGVPGLSEESEWSDAARCVSLLEGTGARLHLTHLSSPESVRIASQAAAKGLSVTCDVTPHHLALNHHIVQALGTAAKMNPPLRSEESRRELVSMCAQGLVGVVASDHAPHTRESKDRPLHQAAFGVTGLETLLPVTMGVLSGEGGMSPLAVAAMLSIAPAAVLGIEMPDLRRETCDSLVLYDPGEEWVYQGGYSLSRNTPFLGTRLTGRVVMTLFRGRVFQ